MENQDAYELIFDWLARPGATKCMKLVEGHSVCVYDDGAGNHCAIGGPMRDILGAKVLYTDEMWDDLANINKEKSRLTNIGGFSGPIEELIEISGEVNEFWGDTDVDFLKRAQTAHDAPENNERWQFNSLYHLNDVATDYGLELKEIPEYVQQGN